VSDLETARELFQKAGLAFPTIPDVLAERLKNQGEWLFSTRVEKMWPYILQEYVDEAEKGHTDDYALLAHSGYGANSYAIQYYLVFGSLHMFLHLGWGGVYGDTKADEAKIRDCFLLADEIAKVVQITNRIRTGESITIVVSDFYGSYWTVPGQSNQKETRSDTIGLLAIFNAVLDWLKSPLTGPSDEKKMINIINEFIDTVKTGEIDIYNEFSLQHELGIFLRSRFSNLKVQFERNVSFFFRTGEFVKKEIDISIYASDKSRLHYAIELKYPRNGQYPEQMFSFCKDIMFAEELKRSGFDQTFFIAFANDPLFYSGNGDGIYGYFRQQKMLHGAITKPTGKKDGTVPLNLNGSYNVQWANVFDNLKYAVIEAGPTSR
jgi:hypothetical protein